MHFNFHLSGDESPEQSRRIANAVLALGGLTTDTQVGKFAVGIDIDPEMTDEERAERKAKYDEFGGTITLAERKPILSRFVGGIADPTMPAVTEADEYLHGITGKTPSAAIADDFDPPPPAPPIPDMSDMSNGHFSQGTGLDAKGLPWDERIHSSSRAINADGTWRYRKNVPDETKRDVEAELRGLVGTVTVNMDAPSEGVPGLGGNVIDTVNIGAPPVPLPPTPPAPPVPTGALQRTYSDVVNLIMARKVQPGTYVAILGMSLPEFATHVKLNPNDATRMFDAIDAASAT